MNDKQQLAAMGAQYRLTEEQAKGLAERMPQTGVPQILDDEPLCMAKRIEELEAQVLVMADSLDSFREFASANVWDDGEREALLASIDTALAGKLPGPAMPGGWKLVEKANCFVLIHDGQVIASMAGPTSERTAAIMASVLDGKESHNFIPEGWQLVPVSPTQGMVECGLTATVYEGDSASRILASAYRAMLAAAPSPGGTK